MSLSEVRAVTIDLPRVKPFSHGAHGIRRSSILPNIGRSVMGL